MHVAILLAFTMDCFVNPWRSNLYEHVISFVNDIGSSLVVACVFMQFIVFLSVMGII